MSTDSATMSPDNSAEAPRSRRRTRADLFDKRTAAWRRRQALVAIFTAAVATPMTEPLRLKIEAAAELATIAEKARADHLAGRDVALDDVVRTANQAARAERALGIGGTPKPHGPTLAEYLAGRAAAKV